MQSNRNAADSRAGSLIGQKGWYCCKYVAYCIYNNANNNQGGAKGWLSWGQQTNNSNEAWVIVAENGSHVGYVTDNGASVYHAPGVNSQNSIKKYSFQDFVKYVMPQGYKLRKQ